MRGWLYNHFSILCLTTDPIHQGHEKRKKSVTSARSPRNTSAQLRDMAQKIVSRQKHNMLSLLHAACLKMLFFYFLLCRFRTIVGHKHSELMPQMYFSTYRYIINHSWYFYCIHAASISNKCLSKSVNTERLRTAVLILYHTKPIYVQRGFVDSNHSCAHYAAVNTTEVNKQNTHCQWYTGMPEATQPT